MDYINRVKQYYTDKRWHHILGMLDILKYIQKNNIYHLQSHFVSKLKIAILFHDIGKKYDYIYKDMEYYPVYHAYLGYYIAKNSFSIYDKDILNSILFHTTGRENMSMLEIFLYLIDFGEFNRTFKEAEISRNLFFDNKIYEALIYAGQVKIFYVKKNEQPLHINTLKMVRYYEKRV